MLDTILFSVLSSLIITIISYMEVSASEPDNEDMSRFIKIFIISLLVNLLGIFIFKNMSCQSVYSQQVEVGLP